MATRRTRRRLTIADKITSMEKVLSEIKALVNIHCGEQSARAAGAAAAEEVIQTLLPTQRLSPVQEVEELPTPQPSRITVQPNVPEAPVPEAKKKSGPTKWNEFLKNYMRNQEAAGRKISRPQAMKEAGINYRKKYGLPEPKPKNQTAKIQKTGVTVAQTPARQSPPGVLDTLKAALSPVASATPASTQPNTTLYRYNNEGLGMDKSARKIRVDGEEYFMTNLNRGLFKRTGDQMGEWVGYLETDGEIRKTNSPDENIM